MGMTNFSDLNLKVTVVDGGAAGDLTVTGISTDDVLKGVISLNFADDTDTGADLLSEFSITDADTINNTGGTATTDAHVLVIYIDKDAT